MQRELWSIADLRNTLTSTYLAATLAAPTTSDPMHEAYLRGFRAALVTLALGFGLPSLRLPEAEMADCTLPSGDVQVRLR